MKSTWMTSIGVAALMVVTGDVAAQIIDDDEARDIPFEIIDQGHLSGVSEQMFIVIRNEYEYDTLWRRHDSGSFVGRARPPVDFTKEMVVGVFAGTVPSCGYGIGISEVEKFKKKWRVDISIVLPPPDAILCQTIMQPFEIVKLPHTSKFVSFKQTLSSW